MFGQESYKGAAVELDALPSARCLRAAGELEAVTDVGIGATVATTPGTGVSSKRQSSAALRSTNSSVRHIAEDALTDDAGDGESQAARRIAAEVVMTLQQDPTNLSYFEVAGWWMHATTWRP